MACCVVVLDKQPGGIGETLRRALVKVVMRAAGNQAETACGNLHLCAGLESGIEVATHDVGHQRLARVRERRGDEEEAERYVEEEVKRGVVDEILDDLTIETAGT